MCHSGHCRGDFFFLYNWLVIEVVGNYVDVSAGVEVCSYEWPNAVVSNISVYQTLT